MLPGVMLLGLRSQSVDQGEPDSGEMPRLPDDRTQPMPTIDKLGQHFGKGTVHAAVI